MNNQQKSMNSNKNNSKKKKGHSLYLSHKLKKNQLNHICQKQKKKL
jgi:hypothetical protein